jgi:hypothetical protein
MSKEKKEIIHYADQYDIPRVSPSEAIQQIKMSIKHAQFRGVFCLVGQSGVGKSQIVHQIARDMNLSKVSDVRTAHFSILGGGVPKLQGDNDRFFNILLPPQFPNEDESALIFFDEINQGMQHAISMFFSLIEDRRIYDYELGNKVTIVAAMNPNMANYVVQNIESNAALRRRLKFMYVVSSSKDFLVHARTSQFHYTDMECKPIGPRGKPCHPALLDFLENSPSLIEDGKARDNSKQYACPATWQTASADAYVMDCEDIPLSGDFARVRFAASVGMTMASQLTGYIKDKSAFVGAEDVVLHFEKVRPKLQKIVDNGALEALIGLTGDVLEYIFINEPEKVDLVAENFVKYMMIIPNDASIAVMQQISAVAQANKAQLYLSKLMKGLRNQKSFVEFNKRMEDAHKSIEDKLKTS